MEPAVVIAVLIEAARRDADFPCECLRVDGGASVSDVMMQFQSNILGMQVDRPENVETTALGAAYLAGLAVGVWKDTDELLNYRKTQKLFSPKMNDDVRELLYTDWHRAVDRSMNWAK